jgi:hypothetical protein
VKKTVKTNVKAGTISLPFLGTRTFRYGPFSLAGEE